MKERYIEAGVMELLLVAVSLGRELGKTGVIARKSEPIMSDREWANKRAKEFINSLE